ncbi:hypothetical protein V8F33_005973 [Rhypophila sp. PSN 637]
MPDSDTDPVALNFDGKDPVTVDVVIGTDGAHSKMRTWLLGDEAAKCKVTGYSIANGIVRYKSAEHARVTKGDNTFGSLAILSRRNGIPNKYCLPSLLLISVTPGSHGDMVLTDATNSTRRRRPQLRIPSLGAFTLHGCGTTLKSSPPTALKQLPLPSPPCRTRPSAGGFRSTFQNIDEEHSHMFVSQLTHWPTTPWDNHNGRVTLAGGAAHPMHPNRGQRLNQALNDVDKMITQFIKFRDQSDFFTVEEALDEYEKDTFVRGRMAVLGFLEEDTNGIASPEPAIFKMKSAQGFQGPGKVKLTRFGVPDLAQSAAVETPMSEGCGGMQSVDATGIYV